MGHEKNVTDTYKCDQAGCVSIETITSEDNKSPSIQPVRIDIGWRGSWTGYLCVRCRNRLVDSILSPQASVGCATFGGTYDEKAADKIASLVEEAQPEQAEWLSNHSVLPRREMMTKEQRVWLDRHPHYHPITVLDHEDARGRDCAREDRVLTAEGSLLFSGAKMLGWRVYVRPSGEQKQERQQPMQKLDAKFYGQIRKIKDSTIVPEDEYVVFLAQDNVFAGMLPLYRDACISLGCDTEQVQAVNRMIDRLTAWRAAHPERLKNPGAKGEKLLDA